ncbi:hypothetical protein C4J83_2761 [Pseudomonas sp. LBUM920]|nr:hypothetical protein C4J83_2761 [Pseudomonas sp. LBUM920]
MSHGGTYAQLEASAIFDSPSLALSKLVSRVLVEHVDVLFLPEIR